MGARSRNKGKRGELEACRAFTDAGWPARRGVQRAGGPDSPDIVIDDLPGLHVEVKRAERFNLYDALAQSRRDAGDAKMPIVMHRRNDHPWVVVLSFEDFARLVRGSVLEADDVEIPF